jgi:sodium/potassium-transporting ATPase subunit alpha
LGNPPLVINLGVALVILVIIVLAAFFYAVQDFSAAATMASIKGLLSEETVVIRDGKEIAIATEDVLIGDIVVLTLGVKVPADLRLLVCSSDLKLDKSLLTGESEPVSCTVASTDANPVKQMS